jgi:hypothetical protein
MTRHLLAFHFTRLGLLSLCLLFIGNRANGQDFYVYTIGKDFASADEALMRFASDGSFDQIIRDDDRVRYDLDTDGNRLFSLESTAGRVVVAEYNRDGSYVREIADVTEITAVPGSVLRYQADRFLAQTAIAFDSLAAIDVDGQVTSLPISGAVDLFNDGAIVGVRGNDVTFYDSDANVISGVELTPGVAYDSPVIDHENELVYITNLSGNMAIVDVADRASPIVLDAFGGATPSFQTDLYTPTGHLFGSAIDRVFEFRTDGTLVKQYSAAPFVFKQGVAVIPVPEPMYLYLLLPSIVFMCRIRPGY